MEDPESIVQRLSSLDPIREVLAAAAGRTQDMAALARRICEVPAPTFKEAARAAALVSELKWRGMQKIEKDDLGNVVATIDFGNTGACVLVAAHMDTVFPEGTACQVKEKGGQLYGPGIADNAASIAVVLTAAEYLCKHHLPTRGRIALAFTVGEEGLGDLRGMRGVAERLRGTFDVVLGVDGELGEVVREPVGSRRYRLTVLGPGGHSWSDFGRPSALHALIRLAEPLTRMKAPEDPRTTFNIGTFSGGTSVNSIAAEAGLLLDLRSCDAHALAGLEAQAMAIVREAKLPPGLSLQVQRVGDRPVGNKALSRVPVAIASAAVRAVLGKEPLLCASSSDANIPLSTGIPATTLGVRSGSGVHSPEECLDVASLGPGLRTFLLAVLALNEAYSSGVTNRMPSV